MGLEVFDALLNFSILIAILEKKDVMDRPSVQGVPLSSTKDVWMTLHIVQAVWKNGWIEFFYTYTIKGMV